LLSDFLDLHALLPVFEVHVDLVVIVELVLHEILLEQVVVEVVGGVELHLKAHVSRFDYIVYFLEELNVAFVEFGLGGKLFVFLLLQVLLLLCFDGEIEEPVV